MPSEYAVTAGTYRIAVSDDASSSAPSPSPIRSRWAGRSSRPAGLDPLDEFSLFAILPSGDFEDVRLDETFDLRGKGAERFVAFRSDRDFRLTLNDHELRWGKPAISGAALYTLANVAGRPGRLPRGAAAARTASSSPAS